MIDKILKAAREVSGRYVLHHTAPAPGADQLELLELDVDAFGDLVAAAKDYFESGRSDSHCEACGAPLIWAKTPKGKRAPLDAAPIVGLDADGVQRRIHLSHFATCPHAARFGAAGR